LKFELDFQPFYEHFCGVSDKRKTENSPRTPDALALKLQRVYRDYASKPGGVLAFFKAARPDKGVSSSNHCHNNRVRPSRAALAKHG
jgi:hypothetical protein